MIGSSRCGRTVGETVGHGHRVDAAEPKLRVRDAGLLDGSVGLLDHLGDHVDADDKAVRADRLGGEDAVKAGAAAKVDDDLVGLQLRQTARVATAEPKVGTKALAERAILVAVAHRGERAHVRHPIQQAGMVGHW